MLTFWTVLAIIQSGDGPVGVTETMGSRPLEDFSGPLRDPFIFAGQNTAWRPGAICHPDPELYGAGPCEARLLRTQKENGN